MRKLPALLAAGVAVLTIGAAVVPAAGASTSSTAKKLVIVSGDLPHGWTATKHDSTGDAATQQALAQCAGVKVVKPAVTVSGKDYTNSAQTFQAASKVYVYKSAKVASAQFKAYQNAKYGTCAQQYFEQQPLGPNGEKPSKVEVGKITLKKYAKARVAYGLQATVPGATATAPPTSLISIQTALLQGKAISVAQFNSQGDSSFPQKQGEKALANVSKRLGQSGL